MGVLEEKIKIFLSGSGSDSGSGSGSGSGSDSGSGTGYGAGTGAGDGFGFGYGDGSGYGYGDGSGYGYGDGSGDGSGYGYGYGTGDGDGFGFGSGDGAGYGIKTINGVNVYLIDEVETIITNVHNNIAKGKMLKSDLTFRNCYIAKRQNMFAHGETIEDAVSALEAKIFANLDIDSRIEEFKKVFNNKDKYKGTEFYKWHHLLTGSCEIGREQFVKDKQLDLNKEYTVKEFIGICKNAYRGEIILRLESEEK